MPLTPGNDLLYLGNFSENDDWEAERVNIESTISFFQERYERETMILQTRSTQRSDEFCERN